MLHPHRHESSLEGPLTLTDLPTKDPWSGKIAYLDRDGVLNRWREGYVNNPGQLELLEGSAEAVGKLRRSGFRICIVTNQSPIGRGLWGHDVLAAIHNRLQKKLLEEDSDAEIDLILYSPYSPDQGSWARKPMPGMLEAGRQLIANAHTDPGSEISLSFGENWKNRPSENTSILVGDRGSDIIAAERFGVRGILCDSDLGITGALSRIFEEVGDSD